MCKNMKSGRLETEAGLRGCQLGIFKVAEQVRRQARVELDTTLPPT